MDILRKIGIAAILIGLTACSQSPREDVPNTQVIEMDARTQEDVQIETPVIETEAQSTTQEQLEIQPTQVLTEPSPNLSETIITIWHGLEEEGLLTFREIILAFQRQESGIQINLVYSPYDDLLDQYLSAVETGEGPDLVLGAGEWGHILYDHAAAGDVSNFVSSRLKSEINPPALAMVTYPDLMVGLPLNIKGVVMYRNTSILPEAPESVDDLIMKAREVTTPEVLGAYLDRGSLNSFSQLTACGGSLMYLNGYPAFNNQAGVCWLDLLESYSEAGAVAFNSEDDLNRFNNGTVGTIIEGTWNLGMLSDSLGDNLMIDPWPDFNNSHLSGYVWSENIITPNLPIERTKAAKIFSQFLLSHQAQVILSQHGYIPAITNLEVDDPAISQAIVALSRGTPYPGQPEIELYFKPLFEAFEAVFKRGVDAAEALQSAADQIILIGEEFNNLEGDL